MRKNEKSNENHPLMVNIFMNLLETTIEKVITECEYAEVIGNDNSGGGAFSGDTYAKGDTRVPKILGPIVTRNGTVQSRNSKKKDKQKKKLTL